ncbi:MAG: glycosyltransferase, partial [Actinobacteria bacterium]|nr:glycosyltransferase [Actinomycetota bacterium]NIS37480.1 glycosyltransferase [Actinomycetota bacterium]NIT99300.1 glycosyltransferase [Actinomycetota bacterium]NIU22897.1 glycosyltransferase [Actinomycetota bacterium]NIU71890.1 glycosyltransferase [Actinomycetota bacterium]
MADPPVDVSVSRDATPSVLAVVVAHHPGEWFDETLESLVTQDYRRLEVLVVDAAGDPALVPRVHAHLPGASVLDAADTEGFSAAADAVLDTDVDPAFLLICHDDVALAPDAVRLLVTEALRSNAGIAGPKLVEWDAPDRLQHVGYVVDRFAAKDDVVEPGELDQEQYDAVADVTAVPSACVLVRTGLFRTLHGFDPQMTFRGEDVDLCWRAQLAGARVLVVPDARVRHREQLPDRTGVDDVRRTRARHQLRTVAITASRPELVLTLPLAFLLTLGEAFVALVTGRIGQVADVLGAWSWNGRRLAQIRRRRRELRSITRARHADLRALQETGSVRINALVRGQIGREGFGRAGQGLASAARTGTVRIAAIGWTLVALFVLFGSRKLLGSGVPAVGDFVAFPGSPGDLWSEWWSGWRDRDLGAPGAGPGGLAITALVGWVLGGAVGLTRTLWVLAPLAVGLVGAWRMLAVTGSRRAQLGSLAAYLIIPLPWAAVATASIPGLYGYAAAPWVLSGLLHVQAASPHRRPHGPWRTLGRGGAGLGIAIGLTVAFAPT